MSYPLCFIYVTILLSIIAISGELLRGLGTGYRSLDNHKLVLKGKIERHRNGLYYPLQVEIDLCGEANHRKTEVGDAYFAVRLKLAVGRFDYSVADSPHRGFERGIRPRASQPCRKEPEQVPTLSARNRG